MKALKWTTFLFILLTIVFNFYTAFEDLFGNTVSELSETYKTLANPAGYAFSIWSVIYLGLFIFGIWQLNQSESQSHLTRNFYHLLLINLFANMLWLICFHSEQLLLSMLVIIILLLTLLLIVNQFYQDKHKFPNWIVLLFETYLGWVSVATLLTIAFTLQYEFNFTYSLLNQQYILLATLILVSIISTIVSYQKGGFTMFNVVLIWAFIAIHLKQKAEGYDITFLPLLPLIIVIPSLLINSFQYKRSI